MKIPIKAFRDDQSISFEERFNRLLAHHEEETKFLIAKLESDAVTSNEYLVKLLTVMGQMEHMPRVKVPPLKGEPKVHCHCRENPADRMSMKTDDRMHLIAAGWKLVERNKDIAPLATQQVLGEDQRS